MVRLDFCQVHLTEHLDQHGGTVSAVSLPAL
jgi:hypothetical protein